MGVKRPIEFKIRAFELFRNGMTPTEAFAKAGEEFDVPLSKCMTTKAWASSYMHDDVGNALKKKVKARELPKSAIGESYTTHKTPHRGPTMDQWLEWVRYVATMDTTPMHSSYKIHDSWLDNECWWNCYGLIDKWKTPPCKLTLSLPAFGFTDADSASNLVADLMSGMVHISQGIRFRGAGMPYDALSIMHACIVQGIMVSSIGASGDAIATIMHDIYQRNTKSSLIDLHSAFVDAGLEAWT